MAGEARKAWALAVLALGEAVIIVAVTSVNWWGAENPIGVDLPGGGITLVDQASGVALLEIVLFLLATGSLFVWPAPTRPRLTGSLAALGVLLTLWASRMDAPHTPTDLEPFDVWPVLNTWVAVLIAWIVAIATLAVFSLQDASPDSSDG